MTRRERVLKALAFEETDRAPLDLAGMASTGISCFAYPSLVSALGLPARRPRVYDTGQMLALPDLDVLDALNIDVVTVMPDSTNAFDQPGLWHAYDFNGRLPALVRDPGIFEPQADGTITQPRYGRSMPPSAHVFEAEHGGQPFDLVGEIPRPDLTRLCEQIAAHPFEAEEAFAPGRQLAGAALLPDEIITSGSSHVSESSREGYALYYTLSLELPVTYAYGEISQAEFLETTQSELITVVVDDRGIRNMMYN